MKPIFRIEHVYGRSEADASLYLTRYIAGPFRFHVFVHGDRDPAPHDHPWNFWTFPLRGYYEEVVTFDHPMSTVILQ